MTFHLFCFNNQCKGKGDLECRPRGLVWSPRVQPQQLPAASSPPTCGHLQGGGLPEGPQLPSPCTLPSKLTPRYSPGGHRGEKRHLGLPWWRSGEESACQCEGHGFEPWSGKIPHAAEQLSPCATTTEPTCRNY